ncbi:CoA transferase [Streptomyces sp. NPDC090493]|uniref:CoA transferase n=1 Tax=Streptomyces sp. NPDC090493 TaxID=3365964 RepID=UPI0038134A07
MGQPAPRRPGRRALKIEEPRSGVDAGREVFERLVREPDAVCSNLRGNVPARTGLTHDDLKHLNPAVVCCSLAGHTADEVDELTAEGAFGELPPD